MLFRRKKAYCRNTALEAAAAARARGKSKKAIAEYMKVLSVDPADHAVHGKVAPLLAARGGHDEAWKSFQAAAEGYIKEGFHEKAIGVYAQAGRLMPRRIEVWEAIAGLQMERNLRADAVNTLFRAHRFFKGRKTRDTAIGLLRKAFAIAPWHFEVTYELARLLAKAGNKEEALRLYEGLATRSRGMHLRRVRSAIMKLRPTPVTAWRWLRAAFSGV